MGISVSAVGQAINGRSNAMTAENTLRAARFLHVSPFWLATGEGPMRVDDQTPAISRAAVAEPAAAYWSPRDVLNKLGEMLTHLPAAIRPAFGDLLGGWAVDGGNPSRVDALLALLSFSQNTSGKEAHRGGS